MIKFPLIDLESHWLFNRPGKRLFQQICKLDISGEGSVRDI